MDIIADSLDIMMSGSSGSNILTGTEAPDSLLGKEGDYYYRRGINFNCIQKFYNNNSSTYKNGFEFSTKSDILITSLKGYTRGSTTCTLNLGTLEEIIYTSEEFESIEGYNEIVLETPIRLTAGVHYIIFMSMTNQRAVFDYLSSIETNNFIEIHAGRYGSSTSSSYPFTKDTEAGYGCDFTFETVNGDEVVYEQYKKTNNTWNLLIGDVNTPPPNIQPLNVIENGTYIAPIGVDGFSPITVSTSGGGGSSFQRTLLYDSGSYDTYAPYNTAVNLLNNLSDYDEIMIVTSSEGDVVNNIFWNVFFDVPSCLEENQRQSFTLYNERAVHVIFTDTTFQIVYQNAVTESSSYIPRIYKIYGYKY